MLGVPTAGKGNGFKLLFKTCNIRLNLFIRTLLINSSKPKEF